jgi:hypothetical protein
MRVLLEPSLELRICGLITTALVLLFGDTAVLIFTPVLSAPNSDRGNPLSTQGV